MTNKLKQRKKNESLAKENDFSNNGTGVICSNETSLGHNVSLTSKEDAGEIQNIKSTDHIENYEKDSQKNAVKVFNKKKNARSKLASSQDSFDDDTQPSAFFLIRMLNHWLFILRLMQLH
ncbi:hypothetical protein CEXT_258281 [Caerostris extrusa]|uniref:Uncharacterized protein n=1 Tax=Caerostris extrusa TaxID=172846 RepID=A0AAV4NBW1_CAEEX|nr:hypothetical protein CEXT_258281 [Caerostris extrusa]